MRIGFDAKRAFLNRTGLGNYSRNLIQNLVTFFPENSYILFSPSVQIPEFKDKFSGFPFKLILPKLNLGKWYWGIWRSLGVKNRIEEEKLDLYHGLSGEIPILPTLVKYKLLVTVHDLIFIRYPHYYKPLDRYFYKKKLEHAIKKSDHILAISQQTKNDLIAFLKVPENRVSVIYQGCDNRFYKFLTKETLFETKNRYKLPDRFILFVGTLETRKNALELVKAYAGLDKNLKDSVSLIFIGRKTPYINKIYSFLESNQIQKKYIKFLHSVKDSELPHFYQLAELFVYPSIFEGFGIPILEAIVSGCPVITSLGSGFKEAGGEESIYINPMNTCEFTISIKKVLEDKGLQAKMKENGFRHAKKFESSLLTQQLMDLYKKMVNY